MSILQRIRHDRRIKKEFSCKPTNVPTFDWDLQLLIRGIDGTGACLSPILPTRKGSDAAEVPISISEYVQTIPTGDTCLQSPSADAVG